MLLLFLIFNDRIIFHCVDSQAPRSADMLLCKTNTGHFSAICQDKGPITSLINYTVTL